MHYTMWQIIYAIIFIILFSDLFYSNNEVSANEKYKTAESNTKQNNNARIESSSNFLIILILSIIISIIIYFILYYYKRKLQSIVIRINEDEAMDVNGIMNEGRNESRDQHIRESIDDIWNEDTDNISNESINSNWKKKISESMQNYIPYFSLESIPKRDQTPEKRFNSSVSIINEKGKNRYKRMNKSIDKELDKRKVKHLSLERIPKNYVQRWSLNFDDSELSFDD